MPAIGVTYNNPGDLTVNGPNSFLYYGQNGVYSSPNGLFYPTFPNANAGGGALVDYITSNVGTDPNSSLTTPSEFASYYLNGSYGPLQSTANNPHAQNWLKSFLGVIGIGPNDSLASVSPQTIARGVQVAEGTTALGSNIFGAPMSGGQDIGSTGDGGILGGIWQAAQGEWNNVIAGGQYIGANGVVAGGAVLAGANPSSAASNPGGALTGQLFGPLIAFFQGINQEFITWETKTFPNAVVRVAVGLVAIVLIIAGVMFLASQNKTVIEAVKTGALAAA